MASKLYNKERNIGRKAASMAEEYVKRQIRMELTIRNKGDALQKIKPLMEATKVRAKMGEYRLLGLNFTSSKVGFIQHFGFSGVRDGSTILLRAQRYNESATKRDSHKFKLKSKSFFNNIYVQSGAADYLLQELSKIRAEDVKIKVTNLILELNKTDGKE